MIAFFEKLQGRLNSLIWHLLSTGTLLLLLAVLIVWTEFMVRLAVGLFVIVVSYTFFYFAYRVWLFKAELEKHLRLRK